MTLVALAGSPNCGKTALFNALTGGRQKVANYAGVTVEKKEGFLKTESGQKIAILDLPGTYSLNAHTLDEEITRDVLLGKATDQAAPEILVAVADATNLERSLSLVLELKALKKPTILALNMIDLARRRGMEIDPHILSSELGIPVVPTAATTKEGVVELVSKIESLLANTTSTNPYIGHPISAIEEKALHSPEKISERFHLIDQIISKSFVKKGRAALWTEKIDKFVVHPFWGTVILIGVLTTMFQSIFTFAKLPQEWIQGGVELLGDATKSIISEGPLQGLIVDGIIAGVGSVLVFLPQILLLFFFILALEDSGYMARAAYLMDRLMGKIGLNGRAFIPLLSSHACAIPGIMATRTISNPKDRLTTILVAPLTTCSARLPVYALLIAAFIPSKNVLGFFNLQGLVMLGLYASGILSALVMAFIFRKTVTKGEAPPLLLELPTYKWPGHRNILMGLWERLNIFVRRAGTVILSLSVLIWFLSTYPAPPVNAEGPAINYSYAGTIGHAIEPLVKPIGFDWRISIALIPGFAAREVMVGALATVYAVENADETIRDESLAKTLSQSLSLATALSLMVWYIFALQCLSTVAVTKRETNGWKWPLFMLGYLTVLAYGASYATFHITEYLQR